MCLTLALAIPRTDVNPAATAQQQPIDLVRWQNSALVNGEPWEGFGGGRRRHILHPASLFDQPIAFQHHQPRPHAQLPIPP